MPSTEEKFDLHRIDCIKRSLRKDLAKGLPKAYEIIVDDMVVVPRTSDMEEFDDYEDAIITGKTRYVKIMLYNGTSNRYYGHTFLLERDSGIPGEPQNGLGSLGNMDTLFKQRLDERDKDNLIKVLQEKLAEKQAALDEAEEYHQTLQQQIETEKANRFKVSGESIPQILAEVGKYLITRNADKSPFLGNISNVLGMLNGLPPAQPPAIAAEAEEECKVTINDNPPDDRIAQSIRKMQEKLNDPQLRSMNQIIVRLIETPGLISEVEELLTN